MDGVEVAGGHHDDDLVDLRMAVEYAERVLHDRAASDLDELLGDLQTHPTPHPAGQQNGDVLALSRHGSSCVWYQDAAAVPAWRAPRLPCRTRGNCTWSSESQDTRTLPSPAATCTPTPDAGATCS